MSRRFASAASVGRFFGELAVTATPKLGLTAVAITEVGHGNVRKVFGDDAKLQALAPSTIAQKTRRGYAEPEAPLVATGAMRDSSEMRVETAIGGFRGGVGTDDPKQFYHELGTPRVPPRPVYGIAAHESLPEQKEIARMAARSIGMGERLEIRRGIAGGKLAH